MFTEPYKLTRRCEVTAILILFGLPRYSFLLIISFPSSCIVIAVFIENLLWDFGTGIYYSFSIRLYHEHVKLHNLTIAFYEPIMNLYFDVSSNDVHIFVPIKKCPYFCEIVWIIYCSTYCIFFLYLYNLFSLFFYLAFDMYTVYIWIQMSL